MTLVVLEHDGARVSRASWEAVAAAQQLRRATDRSRVFCWATAWTTVAAEAAAAGVGAVRTVDDPALALYSPDAYGPVCGPRSRP